MRYVESPVCLRGAVQKARVRVSVAIVAAHVGRGPRAGASVEELSHLPFGAALAFVAHPEVRHARLFALELAHVGVGVAVAPAHRIVLEGAEAARRFAFAPADRLQRDERVHRFRAVQHTLVAVSLTVGAAYGLLLSCTHARWQRSVQREASDE